MGVTLIRQRVVNYLTLQKDYIDTAIYGSGAVASVLLTVNTLGIRFVCARELEKCSSLGSYKSQCCLFFSLDGSVVCAMDKVALLEKVRYIV